MKWKIDTTECVVWLAAEAGKSFTKSMKSKLGICFTKNICTFKNSFFQWCTLYEENQKIGDFLLEKFKNKNFSSSFVKDYSKFDKDSIKFLNKLDKVDFSKLNDKELFKTLEEVNNIYVENFDFGAFIEPMDYVIPGLIENKLKKFNYTNKEINDMMAIADTTFLSLETQDIIEISKQSKNKQEDLLKKHAYEFRWIQSGHCGKKIIPFSYFEEKLKEASNDDNSSNELLKLKNLKSDVLKRKKEILLKKPVDKESLEILRIIDLISPLHDRRKELFLRSIYVEETLREEIAKRYGYSVKELSVFQIEDLLKLLNGEKLDKKFAHDFFKQGVLYIDSSKRIWEYYFGEKAEDFRKKELSVDHGDVKELKGMPACSGKVKGVVCLIHGIKTFDKMKQGNILVTSMTRPDFVPAMKKAAAIVTDEGGVTCHAAIVSRELGIPCVIGTKIASKVLKDGDLIEVDANKGIVRKI
jgi:phosphoenolpyruvate synthase/pyruvate phosphate dikinase